MWIARDKSGELCFFYETKPYKNENRGFWLNKGKWRKIPEHWFPEIKWEDEEPRELILK